MKVGIIGAGTMGTGIALAFAQTGKYPVVLCDVKQEYAEGGKKKIASKLDRLVQKEKLSRGDADAIVAGITPGVVEDVRDCGLVLEAAFEDMEVKKELFLKVKRLCAEGTLFASNTSSLSLTEMAQAAEIDIVGMHFFNPAEVMKLVEVTAGENTPPAKVDAVVDLARELGKVPVVVREAPGFVVNRILIPMINEAVNVLAEGTASAGDIDTAMCLGANHPMGPLALADLVGLDVCLAIMEVLQAETGDDKYRPHPLLRKMVRAGKLGRKTGRGFFEYPPK